MKANRPSPGSSIELPQDANELDGWKLTGLDYPSFRLSLVAKIIDRLTLRDIATRTDLSMAEWRVLSRLSPSDGMTVGQIAERAWVDRAEVSRAAAALERRGLTGRRENPEDLRTPILFATDAGRALCKTLLEARGRFHERVLANLSPLEGELLDALLKKLADRLMAMAASPPTEP